MKVIVQLGVRIVRYGVFIKKSVNCSGILKIKVGAVSLEPVTVMRFTLGETLEIRKVSNIPVLWLFQEKPPRQHRSLMFSGWALLS